MERQSEGCFRLDPAAALVFCPATLAMLRSGIAQAMNKPAAPAPSAPRRINWLNVSTVVSAAILIAAEVFGAAFAGGWAIAGLLGLGDYGVYTLQVIFFVAGIAVMVAFVRAAQRVEPFVTH
jgi:hypothetical protein